MQLTSSTNYAFRILMYLASSDGEPVSLRKIADAYGISFNHLKKVAPSLMGHGYISTSRGKYGGIYLLKSPENIKVGDVIRAIESSLCLFECFDKKNNISCPLIKVCQLKILLHDALRAFMNTLDSKTIADLVQNKEVRKQLSIMQMSMSSENLTVSEKLINS